MFTWTNIQHKRIIRIKILAVKMSTGRFWSDWLIWKEIIFQLYYIRDFLFVVRKCCFSNQSLVHLDARYNRIYLASIKTMDSDFPNPNSKNGSGNVVYVNIATVYKQSDPCDLPHGQQQVNKQGIQVCPAPTSNTWGAASVSSKNPCATC